MAKSIVHYGDVWMKKLLLLRRARLCGGKELLQESRAGEEGAPVDGASQAGRNQEEGTTT
jgi:hypothetical protein